MKRPRKEPRLNIRFSNLQQMDQIELFANQRGFNVQDWVRMLVMRELTEDLSKKLLVRDGLKSLYTLQAILEQVTDKQVVQFAQRKAGALTETLNINNDYYL